MKKKILFMIHDLGYGGAEKVLINLVNNMDRSKFDITVMALFGGGVNEQFLKPHIRLINCHPRTIPGNSKLMKLLSPEQLHRMYIKEHYDIEVAYLEGPSARIISGCTDSATKKVCWIHIQQSTQMQVARAFRSLREAINTYNSFDRIICVSEAVKADFTNLVPTQIPVDVLYNTNESQKIIQLAKESAPTDLFSDNEVSIIGVGKLMKNKGFDRLIPITKKLHQDGHNAHLYLLGAGVEKDRLEELAAQYGISDAFTLLGYQINPYKFVANCDLFVCASFAEGFSTAATEALIVGTPVCTVEVSGMKEMLGENNEWGIVTENDEEALYRGIKRLLDDPTLLAHYKEKAAQRGKTFSTENTVKAVEEMLLSLLEN